MLQYGETALHKAALSGHVEAIELLVKHEAAVDIRNKVLLLITWLRHALSECH